MSKRRKFLVTAWYINTRLSWDRVTHHVFDLAKAEDLSDFNVLLDELVKARFRPFVRRTTADDLRRHKEKMRELEGGR